jgi:hypothetical protein
LVTIGGPVVSATPRVLTVREAEEGGPPNRRF